MRLPKFFLKTGLPAFFNSAHLWELLVFGTFFLLIIAALLDGYVFIRFARSQKEESLAGISKAEEVDAKKFENVFNYLEEKESRFKQNLSQKPEVKDPSK